MTFRIGSLLSVLIIRAGIHSLRSMTDWFFSWLYQREQVVLIPDVSSLKSVPFLEKEQFESFLIGIPILPRGLFQKTSRTCDFWIVQTYLNVLLLSDEECFLIEEWGGGSLLSCGKLRCRQSHNCFSPPDGVKQDAQLAVLPVVPAHISAIRAALAVTLCTLLMPQWLFPQIWEMHCFCLHKWENLISSLEAKSWSRVSRKLISS